MFSRAPSDTEPYDEFAFLPDVADEVGGDKGSLLEAERFELSLSSGQHVSGIRWGGDAKPEYVFLHGGGQNAHTWDSLQVLFGKPAICFDLPGHGRSDRRDDRDYGPWQNAIGLAEAIEQLGIAPVTLVGMSLGGATTIRLAGLAPHLFSRYVIIDVSPNVSKEGRTMTPEQRGSVALIGGPPKYESFDAMADATIAMSPLRSPEAIRRGVRHNAVRLDSGEWMWKYDLFPRADAAPMPEREWTKFEDLWNDVAGIKVPTMLVQGALSVYVLPEDVEQYKEVLPSIRYESVEGAGHAVQSDQPAALASILFDFEGN